MNQDLEVECKKLYDRVWKTANRQGQLDWLKSVYYDDDRLAHLLSRYREQTKGNARKNPFRFADYKEKFCAKSIVLQDDEGEMMEEEEFIAFQMNKTVAPFDFCTHRYSRRPGGEQFKSLHCRRMFGGSWKAMPVTAWRYHAVVSSSDCVLGKVLAF